MQQIANLWLTAHGRAHPGEPMSLQLSYDYKSCVENSEKVSWLLDDVFPVGTRLDFARPFLPERLAPTRSLAFLSDEAQRALNQIAANAYLNLFAFVEEYILATVVKHTEAELFGDPMAMRALLRFADEEVKHQQLFTRFRDAFDRDFGVRAGVLDNAAQVAGVIMSKSPIAVMMVTLHIEFMTQQHYTESVRDDRGIDPMFAHLLKNHWLEEAQHARIDALELRKLTEHATPEQIAVGFADYVGLLDAFHGLLANQAAFDVAALERRQGREFTPAQREQIVANQLKGYDYTFLYVGATHPTVVDILKQIDPAGAQTVAEAARKFG